MIVTMLVLTGCHKSEDGGGESANSTTPILEKESDILAPPSAELKAQGYDDQYVKVVNTERPNYTEYRKEWKRVNANLTDGYKLVDKHNEIPVEVKFDELPFREAFILQYRAKGEGHTFWWRSSEYTTNLLHDNPSVDKE